MEHVTDLDERLRAWQQSAEPRFTSVIADDRLSWSVDTHITPWPPPVGHAALVAGDAIHNLRSSLDVVVWDHTDTSGLTQAQKQQIGFPICDVDNAALPGSLPSGTAPRSDGCLCDRARR